MTTGRTNGRNQHVRLLLNTIGTASVVVILLVALACNGNGTGEQALSQVDHIPTPDRSEVQVIDDDPPSGLTDADAVAAYQQGYVHMREAAWFSAVAAYGEAIRIQPDVAGLYEARGTAYMYAGRHDAALADYTRAIELNPNDAGHWRQRAHAFTIAPTPEPESGIEDANRAIELDPEHAMGYGHRAVAYIQLPTPEWDKALVDIDRYIELFEGHDPEAHRLRAWIHGNLGNHEKAEQDRQLAR